MRKPKAVIIAERAIKQACERGCTRDIGSARKKLIAIRNDGLRAEVGPNFKRRRNRNYPKHAAE